MVINAYTAVRQTKAQLPVPFMVASLFSIQFIFTHDPLGFLLRSRPKLESIEALKHIYLHETDEKYDEMYKEMRYGSTWEEHPELEFMEGGAADEEMIIPESKQKKDKKTKSL